MLRYCPEENISAWGMIHMAFGQHRGPGSMQPLVLGCSELVLDTKHNCIRTAVHTSDVQALHEKLDVRVPVECTAASAYLYCRP